MIKIKEKDYFDPFDNMMFSDDYCFLCGKLLTDDNESQEHIFPGWLQEKFNLWDKKLTLLNDTVIPYRRLKIPCCNVCNNEDLSDLENIIKEGIEGGYDTFKQIDKKFIFQWLAKIYYGLLHKELSLRLDITQPNSGPIVTPEMLKEYRMLHTFLQSIIYPINFIEFTPWSIHILKGQDNKLFNFNYIDGFNTLTFSIYLGDVMIFAHLEDNGVHQIEKEKYFADLDGYTLHNIQFIEIAAKTVYSSHLLKQSSPYLLHMNDKRLDIIHASTWYEFNEWNNYEYATIFHHYLSHFYPISFDKLYYDFGERDDVVTYIWNEDRSFNFIPSDLHIKLE